MHEEGCWVRKQVTNAQPRATQLHGHPPYLTIPYHTPNPPPPTPTHPIPLNAPLQTKDTLTLRAGAFGSKCELPEPFLKKVAGCGIVDSILNFANFKANKELKKGDGAKRARLTGGMTG
jgi:hypothetical protein